MPAINFKPECANAVQYSRKRQTIRRTRKSPIREGDRLYLFTGLRTQACRRLRNAIADEVIRIHITSSQVIILGNEVLSWDDANKLAKEDGFESHPEMIEFFKANGGLPLEGQLIKWL